MLSDEAIDRIEGLGWSMSGPYPDGCLELERETPAGEDWIVTLRTEPGGADEDLADSAFDFYDDFDVAEELDILLRIRGERGVPSSAFVRFADQIWKEIELDKLWQVAKFGKVAGLDGLHLAAYDALSAFA